MHTELKFVICCKEINVLRIEFRLKFCSPCGSVLEASSIVLNQFTFDDILESVLDTLFKKKIIQKTEKSSNCFFPLGNFFRMLA